MVLNICLEVGYRRSFWIKLSPASSCPLGQVYQKLDFGVALLIKALLLAFDLK